MATTVFTFGWIDKTFPAMLASTFQSETLTPSAANQVTVMAAPSTDATQLAVCVATDTQVYVTFGPAPNALTSTTARKMIPAGGSEYFRVNVGDKCAVTTAP